MVQGPRDLPGDVAEVVLVGDVGVLVLVRPVRIAHLQLVQVVPGMIFIANVKVGAACHGLRTRGQVLFLRPSEQLGLGAIKDNRSALLSCRGAPKPGDITADPQSGCNDTGSDRVWSRLSAESVPASGASL
jgi:hypothetical protein